MRAVTSCEGRMLRIVAWSRGEQTCSVKGSVVNIEALRGHTVFAVPLNFAIVWESSHDKVNEWAWLRSDKTICKNREVGKIWSMGLSLQACDSEHRLVGNQLSGVWIFPLPLLLESWASSSLSPCLSFPLSHLFNGDDVRRELKYYCEDTMTIWLVPCSISSLSRGVCTE